MKIVKIDQKLINKFECDAEMLTKSSRPCVIIAKLTYKGSKYNFAIPFRSNIPGSSPKNEYFPLPPRKTTKPKNRHGLHYIKMFPVDKKYLQKYRIDNNARYQMLNRIINENKKIIISSCQEYLDDYEKNGRPEHGTDIDKLIGLLKS